MSEYDPTATEDEPEFKPEPLDESEDVANEPEPDPDPLPEEDGDDGVHEPADGGEEPPEPGAGLGGEVEETDPEGEQDDGS